MGSCADRRKRVPLRRQSLPRESTCPRGASFLVAAPSVRPGQPPDIRLKGLKMAELYYAALTAASAAGGETSGSIQLSARARQPD